MSEPSHSLNPIDPMRGRHTSSAAASHPFDPGADGLAGIYALRILERGLDPRALSAEVRAERLGTPERGAVNRALIERARPSRFGRGTAIHLHAALASPPAPLVKQPIVSSRRLVPARQPHARWSRRLVAAGIAVLLLLPIGVIAAHAQELPSQSRYIVQEGDTLEGVAAEFGVDPAAILAASDLQNPPYLTPAEVIVIPDPSESPGAAAANAAARLGASPYVVGARDVSPGDTVADIASDYGLDPLALAAFNGIGDVESLTVGQRLRIPLTDVIDASSSASAPQGDLWNASVSSLAVGGGADAASSQNAPVIAAYVPAYMQAYSLSCEYAAAYIATAAFGAGVPESAFMEHIGQSANPHWGYRGDISGAWGGSDDYGVYPEALVPTLNEYGFVADVFYGANPASLTSRLDAGMPVLTWLGYFGDNAWQQDDEGSYLLAPGMHVVTVYGYDESGVYLANPGRGTLEYYGWDDFLAKWGVLGGMAMAVAPM